jgi:hypothetical protein
MKWLQTHRIFIEENDLPTTIPSTVGMVFFVHQRDSLMEVYQQQLQAMFINTSIPEFKIRRFLLKSSKARSNVIIIQAEQPKANEVMKQFDEVIDLNPYEYVSWKTWTTYNTNNKEMIMAAHNKYMDDHKLINLLGFKDDRLIQLETIKVEKGESDYSKYTLNEFICKHYTIEGEENPIFESVMGPYLGTRLFISKAKLESTGKRLAEHIRSDMLQFMTKEVGQAILEDYKEFLNKARTSPAWKPTWFERRNTRRTTSRETEKRANTRNNDKAKR